MTGKYRTIVADPPWAYDVGNGTPFPPTRRVGGGFARSVGPRDTYPRMTMDQLCALKPPAADDAHLYLWTTNGFMCEAHDLARAWGFTPKTILTWGKTHKGDPTRASMKTGYWFRGATEHIVFAVRGSLRLKRRDLPTLYLWPRIGQHSVKPDASYDLIEQASPGPYLELFARRQRLGWDTWGNEALCHIELDAEEAA